MCETVSLSQLDRFYDHLSNGILLVDQDYTIRYMNRWVKEHSNRDVEAKITLDELCVGHDSSRLKKIIQETIKYRSMKVLSHILHSWVIPLPDKRFPDNLMRQSGMVTPFVVDDAKTVWALVQIKDDSDKVLHIQRLNQTNEKLRLQIQERETAENELRRSNEELRQFAYVASHDLQSPLRSIRNFLEIIIKNYGSQLDGDVEMLMARVINAATRMGDLIKDLLNYSKVGASIDEFSEVSCTSLILTVLDELRPVIRKNSIVVQYEELPNVWGDDKQLYHLFQNLISNATKFIKPESPHVQITAESQETEWLFKIKDNGIGIAPQYKDRIFTIFQRLHGQSEYSGTGIGLAICSKIIENHKGKIWVESEEGQGATFLFTLPKVPETP